MKRDKAEKKCLVEFQLNNGSSTLRTTLASTDCCSTASGCLEHPNDLATCSQNE